MSVQVTMPSGEEITLSADQETALMNCVETLSRDRQAILVGAAGTGKTTVMRAVISYWSGPVMFLAPTGIAARRLSDSTGMDACTVHSAIFAMPEEERGEGRQPKLRFGEAHVPEGLTPAPLVVVDESSMVNQKLADQIRTVIMQQGQASVLWVGAHEQLPPVEGGWGVDLANPTARLTRVHRQALESAVLELATLIRERQAQTFNNWGGDVTKQHGTIEDAVTWKEERGDARVLLTWTNKVRKHANRLTRLSRGYSRREVHVGETLLCLFNNHKKGIMNGESFVVTDVEVHEELTLVCEQPIVWVTTDSGKRVIVAVSTFDAYHPQKSDRQIFRDVWSPLYARFGSDEYHALLDRTGWSPETVKRVRTEMMDHTLQATWGYCLTVHKSQGSQWSEVGFISCPGFRDKKGRLSIEDRRRMTYTAVTRAETGFHAFMLQVMPDYRLKNPYAQGGAK